MISLNWIWNKKNKFNSWGMIFLIRHHNHHHHYQRSKIKMMVVNFIVIRDIYVFWRLSLVSGFTSIIIYLLAFTCLYPVFYECLSIVNIKQTKLYLIKVIRDAKSKLLCLNVLRFCGTEVEIFIVTFFMDFYCVLFWS